MTLSGERILQWPGPAKLPAGLALAHVVVGTDDSGLALEVVCCTASSGAVVSREGLSRIHGARLGKRLNPVVVFCERGDEAWFFGPQTGAPMNGPIRVDLARRMLQAALDEPTGLAARQRLVHYLGAASDSGSGKVETAPIPGVANSGLFATHELRHGVRRRADWQTACTAAAPLLRLRREELISRLGYASKPAAAHATLLMGPESNPTSVAVLLDPAETFDTGSHRFSVSPIAYGLAIAQRHKVAWLMMIRGSQLRLYPARPELGVGRKGLAETFFELDLALVTDESAGFLPLIFSAAALSENGSIAEILRSSNQYAVALGGRLRSAVYDRIVPSLAVAVARERKQRGRRLDRAGLDECYQLTLRILFRLLFQAYAEDRKLLPFGENPRYDRNALKTVARDLVDNASQAFDAESTSLWDDLTQVWRVIDKGDKAWSVPPYNGGLFSSDPELHPEGALLESVRITNDVMGPVLQALLVDTAEDGLRGPIDFRSLSVREFGTIYEGLLESNLEVATKPLVIGDDGELRPARSRDDVAVVQGAVYFHSTSGQRKGTGSYFTPSFVVEHLLERSLDPALDDHLARVATLLDKGDQTGAADLFFNFRVADLAMGSGHFLTAAIDHIEAKMAAFLADHPLPGVSAELKALMKAALDAVGPDAPEPEPSSLLRRQVARRCIYGLDINPIAVELARVSIWIHTFVRGLPMSSLDHNLVCANSLTGIGTMDEALDALMPDRTGGPTLYDGPLLNPLEESKTLLIDAANASEATRQEAHAGARLALKAQKAATQTRLLFDAAIVLRLGSDDYQAITTPRDAVAFGEKPATQALVKQLRPAHLPFLFPEVFLREPGGFDVLIGNPPWEEVMVEEHKFWQRIEPGLMGLDAKEMKARIASLRRERKDLVPEYEREVAAADSLRKVLLRGPYPGLGKGDVDLYRVFAWRNWNCLRKNGRLGMVFPRSLLGAAGNAPWRECILREGTLEVVTVVNTGGWVFTGVHPQYTIGLIVANKQCQPDAPIRLAGPFHDRAAFEAGKDKLGDIPAALIRSSEGATFPQLPTTESAAVFAAIRRAPRLDHVTEDCAFQPVREFDATNDRPTFDAGEKARGRWPVYGGSAFDIWNPDTGVYFTWADQEVVVEALADKRRNQARLKRSAFYGTPERALRDPRTLPCYAPRIAFRDVTNATNQRTLIAALVPGQRVLTNKAPYLLRVAGTPRDEAFLVGVLSSRPLDWFARRYVELNLNFHILNGLPIPRPPSASALKRRVIEIAGRLAATDDRFDGWAEEVGVPVGSLLEPATREDAIAELDAIVCHLYGLDEVQVEHLMSTFHRGWDYESHLSAVLKHFAAHKGSD